MIIADLILFLALPIGFQGGIMGAYPNYELREDGGVEWRDSDNSPEIRDGY